MKTKIRNKEISWLSFNARVLQEAADPNVPLIERIKFLGIFSSNQDEFFRVRVATLKRLAEYGKKAKSLIGDDPNKILKNIHELVLSQQKDFEKVYQQILKDLAEENIFIINETQLSETQRTFITNYFRRKVRPTLIPVMIDQLQKFPELKDHAIYFAVYLSKSDAGEKHKYSLFEIPTDVLPRFIILPPEQEKKYIILLDDVIRSCLGDIFYMFDYDRFSAFTIKLTRDAELDFDDDLTESFIKKVSKSLGQRKIGNPIRFVYDQEMPEHLLKFLIKHLKLEKSHHHLIAGTRYHNFKDFMNFPEIGSEKTVNIQVHPLPHRHMDKWESILKVIQKRDILLHYPYQTFDYIIDFLREAAIDPKVISIKITLYRVAKTSQVINALINAAKNGKTVTVILELQARFDEEANIEWANRLTDEGVRVIHGVPGLKVHAKLILVTRKVKQKVIHYVSIGTGNFNEATSKIYSDHSLFTCDLRITKEVLKAFDFIESNYRRETYRHLLVAPFNLRNKVVKLINEEIDNVKNGQEAYIIFKVNNLTDPKIIKKLYAASQAGVKIKLMVRGMFSLIPGVKGLSENIEARGIVDKYLEHTRLFVFCAGGNEQYYLSSADLMPRNLDNRVEVAVPIYDKKIQREIKDFLEMQWLDNVKARFLKEKQENNYIDPSAHIKVRAQVVIHKYFENRLRESRRIAAQMATEEAAREEAEPKEEIVISLANKVTVKPLNGNEQDTKAIVTGEAEKITTGNIAQEEEE